MKDVVIFEFADLVGQEFDFYGVDGQRFRLNDVTYEAIEASAGHCEIVVSDVSIDGLPIARVVVENAAFNDDCYELNDLHDGHCWLEFGDHCYISDYEFYFEYSPKGPTD